jgi:acetylxylan esterase
MVHLSAIKFPQPGKLVQILDLEFHNTTRTTPRPDFHIYVPKILSPEPAVIVAIHYCTGTGPKYFQNSPYGRLAEKYGFIVVYPTSPHDGTCWDVSSKRTLRHGKGGDSGDIVDMVRWVLGRYTEVDRRKVFVVGMSSGAMMTVGSHL